jgi:uncharacterized protein (TIGR02996 family)
MYNGHRTTLPEEPPVTHDEALRQAIIEDPDDDLRRFVYADWVEEQGQPERAEFIRVQCQLARWPEGDLGRWNYAQWLDEHAQPEQAESLRAKCQPDRWPAEATEAARLGGREGRLLERHQHAWLDDLRVVLKGWRFRRGFVEEVSMGVKRFLEHGERLFSREPVRRLKLHGASRLITHVAAHALLARLRALSLQSNGIDDSGAEALAASSHLRRLELLELQWNRIGDRGAKALAASAAFGLAMQLELCGNPIGGDGRAALRRRFGDRVHGLGPRVKVEGA